MGEVHGLTAEQYQAIVAIVDDRLEAVRVTREGFERLVTAIARLTETQARTETRLDQLATAQARTEMALQQLARQCETLVCESRRLPTLCCMMC